MKMKWTHTAVLVALMSASPLAFQGDSSDQRRLSAMMRTCQDQMASRQADGVRLARRLNEARQSDDPATMRAALEEAQKHLAGQQELDTDCMQAMRSMALMRDEMSGMMGRGMMQQPGGTAGMMPGACCPPGRGLHGAAAIAAWTGGALLFLATMAVLSALALFLWRQAQATRIH